MGLTISADEDASASSSRFAIAHAVGPSANPMGESLQRYIQTKVHQLIRERRWLRIVILGKYAREAPYIIADSEKSDKPFNRHRPTARVLSEDTLELACFPGRDYVKHYALLVASYLVQTSRPETRVHYEQVPDISLSSPIANDDPLRGLGAFNTVIVGYVDRIRISSVSFAEWTPSTGTHHGLFAWKKCVDGRSVALLGCMFSFWGDISVQLVRALAEIGTATILYIGKAGTLDASIEPNECIATGSASLVDGELVRWHSVLGPDLGASSKVRQGVHINTSTPLDNEFPPRRQRDGLTIDWIDCEAGLMARECNRLGLGFAYLHIISDNLVQERIHGLWNERAAEVLERRRLLLQEISAVLDSYVQRLLLPAG
jgi:hypothetical protein